MPYLWGLTTVVRKLRRNMTEAERLLWSRLRRKQIGGVCFYRQRIIGEYIVDFYCPEARLVVEVDGGQHFQDEGKEKDGIRDSYLKEQGLRVLRFDNHQVMKNMDAVLEVILKTINEG